MWAGCSVGWLLTCGHSRNNEIHTFKVLELCVSFDRPIFDVHEQRGADKYDRQCSEPCVEHHLLNSATNSELRAAGTVAKASVGKTTEMETKLWDETKESIENPETG